MKLNLNDQAIVRLTEYGQRILISEHLRFKFPKPVIPEDGSYKCALWALMITFGPYVSMGMTEMVFADNEIEILSQMNNPDGFIPAIKAYRVLVQQLIAGLTHGLD